MSEAATENNDGTMPFGCRELTIDSNVYTAVNFQLENSAKEILQYDHMGKPKRSVGLSDFDRGTATLQIEVDQTVPERHQTFQTDDAQGDVTTYIIRNAPIVETGGASPDAKMCSITFIKKYN
jgi:hypothetical protein